MNIRQASSHELLKAWILAHHSAQGVVFSDVNSIEFERGVLTVDLLNGSPYTVDLTNGNIYTFPSEPGSGTDALRKRIDQRLFTQELLGQRDRPPYMLSVHAAVDSIESIENDLERGPVYIGLNRIIKQGNAGVHSFDLSSGEEMSFTSTVEALDAIMLHEEGMSIAQYRASTQSRARLKSKG